MNWRVGQMADDTGPYRGRDGFGVRQGALDVDEDADHRNSGNHNAAENDRHVLLETLDCVIKVVLGNERVADEFGIVLDKRLGLQSIESGFVESLDRFQCVVGQCRYCWRSLRGGLPNIAPFAPYFQPVLQRSLPAALALLLALPATGIAQSRPIGTGSGAVPDIRETLGDCPAQLLRRAWNEMLPLETAAVEREVLALCTERAEAMARFLDAQSELNKAMALVRAPSPVPEAPASAAPDPYESRVERLRSEIVSLRARIARLEGQPERPETEEALAALRVELAEAEAGLEIAEIDGVSGAGTPGVSTLAGMGESDAVAAGLASDPSAGSGTATGPESALSLPPTTAGTSHSDAIAQADAKPTGDDTQPTEASPLGPQTDRESVSLPPPGAGNLGIPPPADVALPPDTATEWTVIHAVRRDGGPWQVRLQGRRKMAVQVAGPTPEDPYAIHWQPMIDPPVTLVEGESLPGGLTLLEVTAEGVTLADPALDGGPVTVPFATDDAHDPGALEWDFELIRKDDS